MIHPSHQPPRQDKEKITEGRDQLIISNGGAEVLMRWEEDSPVLTEAEKELLVGLWLPD